MRGQTEKPPVRRAVLVAAAVVALAAVAACGPGGSASKGADKNGAKHAPEVVDAGPVAALTLADRSATKAESARVESTMMIGDQSSTDSTGVISWDHGLTGTLTVTITGGTAADTLSSAGMTNTVVRYLPDGFYMDLGEKLAEEADGKHWLRYGYDDLEKIAGASGSYLKDQMQNATPSQGVKPLLASDDVHKVGSEKVRGQDTVHYSGTIRPADFVGKNTHLTAAELTDLKRQLQQSGITTETVDLWVGADGLPVKVAEKARMSAGEMSMTSYYSDYGTKVSVRKPPADDTIDVADGIKAQQKR